jgi:hypothetical protein
MSWLTLSRCVGKQEAVCKKTAYVDPGDIRISSSSRRRHHPNAFAAQARLEGGAGLIGLYRNQRLNFKMRSKPTRSRSLVDTVSTRRRTRTCC